MLKKRPRVWEEIFSSHRPPVGFLGSGWEAGTRRWPCSGLHQVHTCPHRCLPSAGRARETRVDGEDPERSRSCPPGKAGQAHRSVRAPSLVCTAARETQLPSPLKLEVSVSFGGGTKCTCPFEPEGRAGRRGCVLCIFHNQTQVV